MSRPPPAYPATPAPTDIQGAHDLAVLYQPRWRRLAGIHNVPVGHVQALAEDLAPTVRPGEDFVPRWLRAVEIQARKLRAGGVVAGPERKTAATTSQQDQPGSGWLAGVDLGRPEWRLELVEAVVEKLAELGMTLEAALGMPGVGCTAAEWAAARGISVRHARRELALLRELEGVQGDFWGGVV